MNVSDLTPTQLANLNEVASWTNGRFETKVARTIIANGYYSAKQADIVNVAIADYENDLPTHTMDVNSFERMQEKARMNQRPSSMR